MDEHDRNQDEDGRLPVTEGEGQDSPQPATEAETAALEEVEDGPAPTLTHIRAATIGPHRDARVVHAGYLFWNGARRDGRTRPERILRQRCERIAKDKGFRTFSDAPVVMQAAIENYVRLWVVSDLMWTTFVGGGRLPDAFLDFASAMHRKELHLGLKRELRDAKTIDIARDLAELDGRHGGSR